MNRPPRTRPPTRHTTRRSKGDFARRPRATERDSDRAHRAPFFCEEFGPNRQSYFDAELGEAVSAFALARGELHGYCNLASAVTKFTVDDPNLREGVTASASGSRARQRLMVCGMSLALFDAPHVGLARIAREINGGKMALLLAESNTPLSAALVSAVDPLHLTLSEFFGDEYRSGQLVGGTRNEDLRAPSFPDASLDWVLTSDVFEHIPDPETAEREVIRILKPGGVYCFTVPLHPSADDDIVLARRRADGTTEYLVPPTYHGDPLRPEGALLYRIFSVPAMTNRFARLGAKCRTYRLWSKHFGLLGPDCFIHVVKKNA